MTEADDRTDLLAEIDRLRRELGAAQDREQQAERWFRRLAEAMPVLVFTARADGVIDYVNQAFWAYIGRRPDIDALTAGDWVDELHPDDQQPTLAAWAHAVDTGTDYRVSFRIRRHDGQFRWHDVRASPVRHDDGEIAAWFGAAADVHDRQLAEETLAAREAYLRAILDNEPDGLSIVGPDVTIDELNRAGCELLEVDHPDEVLGSGGAEFVHPDDLAEYGEFIARVRAEGSSEATVRLVGRRGTVRWVESRAVLLETPGAERRSVLAVTRDITTQRNDALMQLAEASVLQGLVTGASIEELTDRLAETLDEVLDGVNAIVLIGEDRARVAAAPSVRELLAGVLDGRRSDELVRALPDGTTNLAEDLVDGILGQEAVELLTDAGMRPSSGSVVRNSDDAAIALLLHLRRDGRMPLESADGLIRRVSRLVGLVIDRTRADRAHDRALALLEVASELGRLGGWSVDVPPTLVEWSDEVAAIHGLPLDHRPTVDQAIDFYTPEHRPMISEAFGACVADGTPYDLELQIVDGTDARKWVRTVGQAERSESGRIVRIVGAFQDIDEVKRSVVALEESEERLRLLARATSDVVFDWDVLGQRVWYGEGRERLFGEEVPATVSSDTAMARAHADDRDRVIDHFAEVLRSGDERWTDDFRVVQPDGTELAVHGTGFVLRDDDGRGIRVVGSLVDMTVEQELRDRLARTERLETVGQLTGGVAHDFNNLLTVILGNVDLLTKSLSSPQLDRAACQQAVETIATAADRGADLTSQLLSFARRQPLEPVPVDLGEVVGRLSRLIGRTLPEDITVRILDGGLESRVLADEAQLDAALLNICVNARDAMPDGGVLTIETYEVAIGGGGADAGLGLGPGDYVVIAVSDDGSGIEADVVERVFDPFFSTKPTGEGTGLGLSMVYGFVTQSGGTVQIQSEAGCGTTVSVWLPVARPGSAAPTRPVRPGPAAREGSEHILLVEDDELVRSVVATQLRSLGYRVVEAGDGPSALERLRDDPAVDLVMTDVVMPGGMNGFELAERVQVWAPDCPVLLSSGYADVGTGDHNSLGREWPMLRKPYRLGDLAAEVRRVIDGAPAGRVDAD